MTSGCSTPRAAAASRPASENGIHDGGTRRASPRPGFLPFGPPVRLSYFSTSVGNTYATDSVTIAR